MSAAYDNYNYPKYWDKRDYEHESELIALKRFFDQIEKRKHIIDIGCGFGRLTSFYAKYTDKITLADPSKSLLRYAKENIQDTDNKINFIHSNVKSLPSKTKHDYDTAIMVRVMHHIEDPNEGIEVVSKLLKKDGYFIVEFANKLHGKAMLKNILRGNFTFPLEIFSIDRRSKKNQKKDVIAFVNHHPDLIIQTLHKNGFEIIDQLSVSNLRFGVIKRYVPLRLILKMENILQKRFSRLNFGPSIFILAKKAHNT